MKTKLKVLVETLKDVFPAVSPRSPVKMQKCFVFNGDVVLSTNGDMIIQKKLPEDLGLNIGIDGKHFLEFLCTCEDEDIDLEVKDSGLHVVCGNIEKTIPIVLAEEDLPKYNDPDYLKDFSDDELVSNLRICSGSVGNSVSGVFRGVLVLKDSISSTDKIKIVKCDWNNVFEFDSFSFPVEVIDVLVKHQTKIKKMGVRKIDDSVEFSFRTDDDLLFIGGMITDENVRDLGEFFPNEKTESVVIECNDLDKIIKKHLVYLKDTPEVDREITIKIDKESTVESNTPQFGESKIKIDADSKGVKTSFSVNPSYLDDFFLSTGRIYFYQENSLVLLKNKKSQFLVMAN